MLTTLLLFAGLNLAHAQAAPPPPPPPTPDHDDTVTGKARKIESVGEVEDAPGAASFQARLAVHEGKQHPPLAYLGGEQLGVDPAFIADCQLGLDKIFLRDYQGARAHFTGLAKKYPGWGIAPVGDLLVWQALMLENFDFRFEGQYQTALRRSRTELETSINMPGNEAWEYFLLAGVLGIDSIHTMRKEEWLKALNRGYEAMKMVSKVKERAPDFVDVEIGDGLFNYWVTVVSRTTKAIPDTEDKRPLGIQQMQRVEREGVFLSAPATLAMTYTWIEEGKYKRALQTSMRNQKRYPNNVINNLVAGRVYMYNKQYDKSESTLQSVLQVDKNNRRVHYYLARLYIRWKKLDQALASLDRYLKFTDLSKYDRASALYYKGVIAQRREQYAQAKDYYTQAVKLAKLGRAKRRLEHLKEKGLGG
jgi:tetratricopeptide (TPR) repeat protein